MIRLNARDAYNAAIQKRTEHYEYDIVMRNICIEAFKGRKNLTLAYRLSPETYERLIDNGYDIINGQDYCIIQWYFPW